MPLSDKEMREMYIGIGEMKEAVKNIRSAQESLDKKVNQYMVFSGERKYIYGLIVGLYATVISCFEFKLFG